MEKINKVRNGMKRQLDCSRALCMACADLGNACSEADVRDAQFQNTQFQLDEDLRKRLDEAIVHVLESIDQKIAPFVELEKMVVNRNNLKLDYDHYVRKVQYNTILPVSVCSVAGKLSNIAHCVRDDLHVGAL